ncbi:unnamed protein product, partial [Owenia fusiformis]
CSKTGQTVLLIENVYTYLYQLRAWPQSGETMGDNKTLDDTVDANATLYMTAKGTMRHSAPPGGGILEVSSEETGEKHVLSITGHCMIIHGLGLPFKDLQHRDNLYAFHKGREVDVANIRNYGNGYVKLVVKDDISRYEAGDVLFTSGWKLVSMTSTYRKDKTVITTEKWIPSKKMKSKSHTKHPTV